MVQQQEIEKTGIGSLKVRFNSVFGYYIEVTKSNLDKVPAHYIRKQTVANGERFINPELKEMEGKILGAEERALKLEYELFQRVRETVLGSLKEIQQTASALAQLDVLASFAETARLGVLSQIGPDLLGHHRLEAIGRRRGQGRRTHRSGAGRQRLGRGRGLGAPRCRGHVRQMRHS